METWIKKQNFGELTVDFEELELVLGELLEQLVDAEKVDGEKPVQLTFNLKFEKNGDFFIENIGNKYSLRQKKLPVATEVLADIVEDAQNLVVTAELGGFEETDLNLEVFANKLVVFSKSNHELKKEFLLFSPVETQIVKSVFKNGIIEVVLKKKTQ